MKPINRLFQARRSIPAWTTVVAIGLGVTTSASAATFAPVADATLKKSSSSRNYGSSSKLEVNGNGSSETSRSLIKFSVANLSGTVANAKVRVYLTNGSKDGPGIYTTDPSWSEATVSWSNQPSITSPELVSKGSMSSGWHEYDVSTVVKGNGTFSFVLSQNGSDRTDLSSKEGSNPPQLVITTDTVSSPAPSPSISASPLPLPPSPSPSNVVEGDPSRDFGMTAIYDQQQMINGRLYGAQGAYKEHSIRKSRNGGVYDFELHQGEARAGKDEGRDRTELNGGTSQRFNDGVVIWASYSMMIEKGETWTDNSNDIGQWHAGVGSPPLAFKFPNSNTLQVRTISGSSTNATKSYIYTNANYVQGKWYNVVQQVKFDPAGTGFVKLWLDGQLVLDKSGLKMGYTDQTGYYWKFGIYRETTPTVMSVRFANMEHGTASLLDRVANPKPIVE